MLYSAQLAVANPPTPLLNPPDPGIHFCVHANLGYPGPLLFMT